MLYSIQYKEHRTSVLLEVTIMLYQYLSENYKPNQPIFMSDISLPNVKENNLRQMFKTLCDSGQLKRYDTGIYYIPTVSRLRGGQTLAPSTVAQYKYVARNGLVEGYCSGFTFANQLGLTTQVPYTMEIVSNNAGAKYREVSLKGLRVILRKARTTVNSENCTVLQFLDLLKDIDQYSDEQPSEVGRIIADYVRKAGITKEKIDPYLQLYPDKLFRSIYEMGLYNVLAQ